MQFNVCDYSKNERMLVVFKSHVLLSLLTFVVIYWSFVDEIADRLNKSIRFDFSSFSGLVWMTAVIVCLNELVFWVMGIYSQAEGVIEITDKEIVRKIKKKSKIIPRTTIKKLKYTSFMGIQNSSPDGKCLHGLLIKYRYPWSPFVRTEELKIGSREQCLELGLLLSKELGLPLKRSWWR